MYYFYNLLQIPNGGIGQKKQQLCEKNRAKRNMNNHFCSFFLNNAIKEKRGIAHEPPLQMNKVFFLCDFLFLRAFILCSFSFKHFFFGTMYGTKKMRRKSSKITHIMRTLIIIFSFVWFAFHLILFVFAVVFFFLSCGKLMLNANFKWIFYAFFALWKSLVGILFITTRLKLTILCIERENVKFHLCIIHPNDRPPIFCS